VVVVQLAKKVTGANAQCKSHPTTLKPPRTTLPRPSPRYSPFIYSFRCRNVVACHPIAHSPPSPHEHTAPPDPTLQPNTLTLPPTPPFTPAPPFPSLKTLNEHTISVTTALLSRNSQLYAPPQTFTSMSETTDYHSRARIPSWNEL
jgi:hypothetical protein